MECPICLELFDNDKLIETSCGHTFCKTCLQKSLEVESFVNENENYINKKWPVCRKYVNKARPLYFL